MSLVSISFDASVCWNVSLLNANVELKRMRQQETGRHFIWQKLYSTRQIIICRPADKSSSGRQTDEVAAAKLIYGGRQLIMWRPTDDIILPSKNKLP